MRQKTGRPPTFFNSIARLVDITGVLGTPVVQDAAVAMEDDWVAAGDNLRFGMTVCQDELPPDTQRALTKALAKQKD